MTGTPANLDRLLHAWQARITGATPATVGSTTSSTRSQRETTSAHRSSTAARQVHHHEVVAALGGRQHLAHRPGVELAPAAPPPR